MDLQIYYTRASLIFGVEDKIPFGHAVFFLLITTLLEGSGSIKIKFSDDPFWYFKEIQHKYWKTAQYGINYHKPASIR